LSIVLTASVLFPDITATAILRILGGCALGGVLAATYVSVKRTKTAPIDRTGKASWRMPPLETLAKPVMTATYKVGMGALRSYLFVAMVLVIVKLVELALA
jgi:hypothetical protein